MRRGKKKKDKEANLGKAATFDVEDGADMENPLADGYEPAAAVVEAAPPPVPVAAAKPPAPAPAPNAFAMTTGGAAAGGLSFNQMIALNQSEMTENELTDLTYAFKAADMDGGGSIDPTEFGVMMAVMGVPLAMMTINRILGEAKSGFAAWIKMSDEANTQKAQEVWTECDEDGSGTMDLREIGLVVTKLREMGCKTSPMTEKDMTAINPGGELSFDEFCTWFLSQELPDFSADTGSGTGGLGRAKKEKGKLGLLKDKISGPLKGMTKTVPNLGPAALMKQSADMLKKGGFQGKGKGENGEAPDDEATAREWMEARDAGSGKQASQDPEDDGGDELIFGEFVFMMRAGLLSAYIPGNWQERAEDMRKLREAFDAADVDGNNELELDELEMCIISMNPRLTISTDDIGRVWAVLNPEKKDWITFAEYAKGMAAVKANPELSALVPMDVPNRFMLLSLLIDTPINDEQEALIFDKLQPLEKVGINMLKKLGAPPQTKEEIGVTLKSACDGQLHYLTDEQRKAVNSVHNSCMFQAFFIGTFFNFLVGVNENILVWYYETDGMNDAYWTCTKSAGDPREWNGNISLALCGNTYGDDASSFSSEFGYCSSVPVGISPLGNGTNVSAADYYSSKGGSKLYGGTWSNGLGQSELMCDTIDCSEYCEPLGSTLDDRDKMAWFWGLNVLGIVVGVVFELGLLVVTAVRSAVQVAKCIDLRLVPLNEDRAFVAAMLVRTAFELPDPEGEVMGVEASQEANGEEGHLLHDILAIAYVKGKVLLTGVLGKQVAKRVFSYSTFIWAAPYCGPMLSASLWDTMMCHAIMKNAEIQAIGVTTGVEVFNEILDTFCPSYETDPDTLSDKARVQILRAIGVAIVKHGSMFPTLEILLRHAVNYLNMTKNAAVSSAGVIDNEESLIEDFNAITLDESRAVLCIHMLCYMLDGSVGFSELALWKRMTDRVEEMYQQELARFDDLTTAELREFICLKCPNLTKAVSRVPESAGLDSKDSDEMLELREIAKSVPMPEHATTFDQLIPRYVCQQYRQNMPVTTNQIMATFDPETNTEYLAKAISPDKLFRFTFNEFTYKVMGALTAQV